MKISIVVPNLNYASFLPDCLESIANQTLLDYEVIMIDGGSSDGSVEIMKNYENRNGWHFFSMPGLSQAESIVKGFSQANGEVFCWLNSDDYYLDKKALELIWDTFERFEAADVISASGMFVDSDGHFLRPCKYDFHPFLKGNTLGRVGGFLQPATFWKKEVFLKYGINTSLRYVFDTDFFTRVNQGGGNYIFLKSDLVAAYRLHGSNLSLNIPTKRIEELAWLHRETLNDRFGFFYLKVICVIFRFIDFLPVKVSRFVKRGIYIVSNFVSYLTVYRLPSF